MSSKRNILNKVVAMIEKQARNSATNISFSIYLEDAEPEVYRTRGYTPHDPSNNNQPKQTQTPHSPNEEQLYD